MTEPIHPGQTPQGTSQQSHCKQRLFRNPPPVPPCPVFIHSKQQKPRQIDRQQITQKNIYTIHCTIPLCLADLSRIPLIRDLPADPARSAVMTYHHHTRNHPQIPVCPPIKIDFWLNCNHDPRRHSIHHKTIFKPGYPQEPCFHISVHQNKIQFRTN